MNYTVTLSNNLSGQSRAVLRISEVQLAVSVRKFTLRKPFIRPILLQYINSRSNAYSDYT